MSSSVCYGWGKGLSSAAMAGTYVSIACLEGIGADGLGYIRGSVQGEGKLGQPLFIPLAVVMAQDGHTFPRAGFKHMSVSVVSQNETGRCDLPLIPRRESCTRC